MNIGHFVMATIGCLVGVGELVAAEAQPILVRAEAAIDVDSAGNVVAVEIGGDRLSDVLRSHASAVARQWRFQPVIRDGRAVGGRTFARMHVCLVPDGEEYRVAVDYLGNGPGISRPRKPEPPILPIAELARRGINSLEGSVRYRVGTDGRASLEHTALADPELQKKYGDVWRRQQSRWVAGVRYRPEVVDGIAVPTVLEEESKFEWRPHFDMRNHKARMTEYAKNTDACRSAVGLAGSSPVAVDSPFKRLPEG